MQRTTCSSFCARTGAREPPGGSRPPANALRGGARRRGEGGRGGGAREREHLVQSAEAESTGAGSATSLTPIRDRNAQQRLAEWVERLIKVNSTEQRAQQEELRSAE